MPQVVSGEFRSTLGFRVWGMPQVVNGELWSCSLPLNSTPQRQTMCRFGSAELWSCNVPREMGIAG